MSGLILLVFWGNPKRFVRAKMAITRYNLEAKPDEIKKPLAEFHTLSTRGVGRSWWFWVFPSGFPRNIFQPPLGNFYMQHRQMGSGIPSSWWLNQAIRKICPSQMGSFPEASGWEFYKETNHHLEKSLRSKPRNLHPKKRPKSWSFWGVAEFSATRLLVVRFFFRWKKMTSA